MNDDFDPIYDLDISGLDRAAVLKALYDAASPRGLGHLQAKQGPMSIEEARELIGAQENPWFDYVHGRPLKVGISNDGVLMRYDLYNRDQGYGAAQRVIRKLREKYEAVPETQTKEMDSNG